MEKGKPNQSDLYKNWLLMLLLQGVSGDGWAIEKNRAESFEGDGLFQGRLA